MVRDALFWATDLGIDSGSPAAGSSTPRSRSKTSSKRSIAPRWSASRHARRARHGVRPLQRRARRRSQHRAPGRRERRAGARYGDPPHDFDPTGVYDAGADGTGFSLVYGIRAIEQRNEIDAALNYAGTTIATRSLDTTDTLIDGLVGFRYARELPHNFRYQFAADVSTGDTEYTWSAGPTIAYTFGNGDRYEVTAGYRHMVIDYDTPEHVDSDMSMSGLLVGFRINF